jgi:flagellar biosynthesis protein FlhB
LNDLVPPELYAAVAEVIAWAHQLDEGLKTTNQTTNPRNDWQPR